MAGMKPDLAIVLALCGALGFGPAALGQTAPTTLAAPAIPQISLASETVADADAELTQAAADDAAAHGILAVRAHEAQLRQVLADMPSPFVRTRTEAGQLIYRADSALDCAAYQAAHAEQQITCQGNPFASAGFFLGSYYNEIGQPELALEVLGLGLIAGPDSPVLIAERNAALIVQHRWSDVLAAADRGLAIAGLPARYRALMLRNRGYALTALNRLDEAQQAYQDSLALDPDNALAKNELHYIAGLKAGAPATEGSIFMPNKAKSN
jgi:tetratricopeptide (TPR) repeat protein